MNDYTKSTFMRNKDLYDYPYGYFSEESKYSFLLAEFMLNNGLSDYSDAKNLEIGGSIFSDSYLSGFMSFTSAVLLDRKFYYHIDGIYDKSYINGEYVNDRLLIYELCSPDNSKLFQLLHDQSIINPHDYFKNIISAGQIHNQRELMQILNSNCRVFLGDVFDKNNYISGLNNLESKLHFGINGDTAENLVKYCGISDVEYYEKNNLKDGTTLKLIVRK